MLAYEIEESGFFVVSVVGEGVAAAAEGYEGVGKDIGVCVGVA